MLSVKEAELLLEKEFQNIDLICDEFLKIQPSLFRENIKAELKSFDTVLSRRIRFSCKHFDYLSKKFIEKTDFLDVIRIRHVNARATGNYAFGGGFRLHPSVNIPLMKIDAMKMTFKHALIGPKDYARIPFGGAKGGIAIDPRQYKKTDLIRLIRRAVQKLNPMIGPRRDRLGPDMGVDEKLMDEFMVHYSDLNQDKEIPCGAIVSGKSLEEGGCPGRRSATAEGLHDVLGVIKNSDKYKKYFSRGLRTIVIGFGNVGSEFIKLANRNNLSIIGIADADGAIYRSQGGLENDFSGLLSSSKVLGGIKNYPEADVLTLTDLLKQNHDILVPAAVEGMINKEIAAMINSLVILEGANGPTLPEADLIFSEKNTLVIPDILANAGGTTVSYFEWLQAIRGEYFEEESVAERRQKYMTGGVKRTLTAADKFCVNLRQAALISSIEYLSRRIARKRHYDIQDS